MTPWANVVVSKLQETQLCERSSPQGSVDAWAMQIVLKLQEIHLVCRPTSAGQR